MEEECGLPHLTHLFTFDLCSYYIYFGMHFQQHGAIKDFFQKIHSFVFWFNNATEHPIIEFIFIIGYAFLGFLCSFLSVLVVSSIVGITFSYSSKKLYTTLVLSIFFLLSKSAIELIDGHLVLKGAIALNKANKDIVVPSLSNIPYQDIKSIRIQQLLTEIQNLAVELSSPFHTSIIIFELYEKHEI